MLQIIKNRKFYFSISGVLIILSLLGLIIFGLKLGIDFKGGTLMEVKFSQEKPTVTELRTVLKEYNLEESIQTTDNNSFIIRTRALDEDEHEKVLNVLKESFAPSTSGKITKEAENVPLNSVSGLTITNANGEVVKTDVVDVDNKEQGEESENEALVIKKDKVVHEKYIKNTLSEEAYEFIGPVIGQELKRSSMYSIILVIIAIILYVSWAFRKVSFPVDSYKYGLVAVIALFHDILIVIGIFVFLGNFYNVEVNSPFVAALLTILGYSVNDSIVVFDRIRENLPKIKEKFADIVNLSVNQTIKRSINTSLTTLLVLVAIYFYGGESIKSFILALIIGVIAGTYSSIFLASGLIVSWQEYERNKKS